jgi:uncharacterized protein YqgC (DUF456 family)
VIVASLLGVILTLLTLPGTWLAVMAGAGVALWRPELISWWTVAGALALAIIAEVFEIAASAAGAKRGGASRQGAIFAVVGSLVGALVGSFIVPIIGTIVGAVLGAGIGAVAAERGIKGRTWRDSAKAGQGAAVGRLAATVLKTILAVFIALLLSVAVLVPGM